MKSEADITHFEFLRDLAFELGATAAKVIPADEIVVESRLFSRKTMTKIIC